MQQEQFNEMTKAFFKALKEKTLLIIIDSASKNAKAVFSLVSFKEKNNPSGGYLSYAPMLIDIGFESYKDEPDLCVTYCAGRFKVYILDNVVNRLKDAGVKLPKDIWSYIQYQNCI